MGFKQEQHNEFQRDQVSEQDFVENGTLLWYKKPGETTFQSIERLRKEKPEYAETKLSFAGRLDPMAEGLLLLLVGTENSNREKYLGLSKVYESDFVFGIETDSFDALGKIKNIASADILEQQIGKTKEEIKEKVTASLQKYLGKQMQKFPPFSSKHVDGFALFYWASEERLDEIEIPEHEVEIYSIEVDDVEFISGRELAQQSIDRINTVEGTFRQDIITNLWKEKLGNSDQQFVCVRIAMKSGTGTYVRQLAQDVGQDLDTGAIAYTIKRLEVGDFVLK